MIKLIALVFIVGCSSSSGTDSISDGGVNLPIDSGTDSGTDSGIDSGSDSGISSETICAGKICNACDPGTYLVLHNKSYWSNACVNNICECKCAGKACNIGDSFACGTDCQ